MSANSNGAVGVDWLRLVHGWGSWDRGGWLLAVVAKYAPVTICDKCFSLNTKPCRRRVCQAAADTGACWRVIFSTLKRFGAGYVAEDFD